MTAGAIIVPGNDLDAPFYDRLVEALGRRGVPAEALTLPAFRGLDEAVAHVERATRATLIGHSLGGLLAFLAAARRPAALRRLVLLEPAILPSRRFAASAARAYERDVVRSGRDRFMNWTGAFYRVHDLERYPKDVIERYVETRRTSDPAAVVAILRDVPDAYPLPFARIAVPTLLVRGAHSGWRARLAGWLLARRLPHARRAVIPGAAHWIANERDEAAAETIAGFVSATA